MKILVINTGSSSIKYQLFDMPAEKVLAQGLVEKIGEQVGHHQHKVFTPQEETQHLEHPVADHAKGLQQIVQLLVQGKHAILQHQEEVQAIGHRVVHGGEDFFGSSLINAQVVAALKKNIPLAPLHNPPNILGIEVAQAIFPQAMQVGVFDTAFHHAMPAKAYRYALPHDLYHRYMIRRYGFHGSSHQYVAQEAAKAMGRPLEDLKLITLHLGSGASAAAIRGGKSIDTSMGLTPLEGLIMGTRPGDLDPAIPFF